jgi:hypothetical protein
LERTVSERKITAAELERIANSYRSHRDWDSHHTPNTAGKKQIATVTSAAARLLKAMDSLSDRGRHQLALRLGDKLNTDGAVALLQVKKSIETLADATEMARGDIPRSWPDAAARVAAASLRSLFDHHGIPFSASASDGYESKSLAVEALLAVAADAGNNDMTADAACKWIEGAICENRDNPA